MQTKTIEHADGRRRTTRKQDLFLDCLREEAYEEILVGLLELARDAEHLPDDFVQVVREWLKDRGLDADWITDIALQSMELWRFGKRNDPYEWEFQVSEAEQLADELGLPNDLNLLDSSLIRSITIARTSKLAQKLVKRGIPYCERKALHWVPLYVRPWPIDARFKIDPPVGLPRYEADVESRCEYIKRCEGKVDDEIRKGFFRDVEISLLTDARKGKLRTVSDYIDEQLCAFESETDRHGNAIWITTTEPALNARRNADLAVRYQVFGEDAADIRRAISDAERSDNTESSSKMISASGINKAVSEYLAEIGLPKRPGKVGRRKGTTNDVLEARKKEKINRELKGLN